MNIRKEDLGLDKHFPFRLIDHHIPPRGDMGKVHHWHECLEISYVKSGRGRYYIEDRIYEMGPGDIIIINNIEPHYLEAYDEGMHQPVIIFDPSLVWSHTGLPFDYDYLKPFFERGTDFSNRLDTGNPSAVQVMEHLTAIEQEYTEKSEGYQLMIKARLLILLTILIRHFRDKDKASFNTSANNKRMHLVKFEEVLKYIEQNFCRDIKLEEAASMIYVTPQYFSAFFKKITGVNFVDYLNNVRINHAVRLLKETDKKITHIAMECGFNSTNNFNSAFKKHTGKTPSQFR